MREELRMKPSFPLPLLVLRWSWSLLENLCNFWGIPWAQIVPYGRSIGTAPSIHLARSYPVRGVASYLIWALYDFCFGNLSKHVCPSPSLQHICHLHHRTSDLASNSPKLWSFNSSPFFLHHSLIHWLFALRFCKVQWCRSIGYRDGLSFWSLAKAASACSRNLSSNAGTFGSWPFMILYWLTIADWSRHCGGFISCRFIWHRLTCWLLGCILYALRFRLRFTLPGDIFTNIDKIGDLVTNRHPTNQKFGFYEWCSSFYKTSSFSCQSYEYEQSCHPKGLGLCISDLFWSILLGGLSGRFHLHFLTFAFFRYFVGMWLNNLTPNIPVVHELEG